MKQLRIDVLRGSMIESTHQVDLLAMDGRGAILLAMGQVERSSFPRSAIKPMQALLFASLKEPATAEESARLALSAASHWAQASHLRILDSWHRECGLSETDLVCGPQTPRDPEEQRRLILENALPRKIHNNCSGKHIAFLQYCQHKNYPLRGYNEFKHPLQVELRDLHSELSGVDWHRMAWGVDGCGIPTSYVPLSALVRMSSQFVRAYPQDERVRRVVDSLRQNPEMIAGKLGFCTRVLKESKTEWLVKTGAEGNYMGVNLLTHCSFFLKVHDGGTRAAEHAVLWAMRELGAQRDFSNWIESWMSQALVNWAGENVGTLRAHATV